METEQHVVEQPVGHQRYKGWNQEFLGI
jgi:hypothetical protein